MYFEEAWNEALKRTEIIRSRVQALYTLSATRVPYILLSESSINLGDTVVRRGVVNVERPTIIVPPNNPQFLGFEFDEDRGMNERSLVNFLLVRGISLPSMKYDNKTSSLDIFEGKLAKAIEHYDKLFKQEENVNTGLLTGPEDYWQFSVLIFICTQIVRNAESDIRQVLEEFRRRKNIKD